MLIQATDNDPTEELDEVTEFITEFLDKPKKEEDTPESMNGFASLSTSMMTIPDPRNCICLT